MKPDTSDKPKKPSQPLPPIMKWILGTILAMSVIMPLALVAMPYIEFFNDMAVQPKAKTQGVYGHTTGEEDLVERQPVAGTIPRGYEPYHLEGQTEEVEIQAGNTLKNPVPVTRENLERGRELFDIYCSVCHGPWGEGNGSIVGPDRFPAPPTLHTDPVKAYPDGRLFHIITKGRNSMPGYDKSMPPEDRWKVVNYMHVLHRALNPTAEEMAQMGLEIEETEDTQDTEKSSNDTN